MLAFSGPEHLPCPAPLVTRNTYLFDTFPGLPHTTETFHLDEDLMAKVKSVIIDPHRLQIKENIGRGSYLAWTYVYVYKFQSEFVLGNFGTIFKAILDDTVFVAVKAIRGDLYCIFQSVLRKTIVESLENGANWEVNEFIREGLQMRTFDHPNVMQLIGICWAEESKEEAPSTPPLIVLPYMELGDLKNYLRKHRLEEARRQVSSLIKDTLPLVHIYSIFVDGRS